MITEDDVELLRSLEVSLQSPGIRRSPDAIHALLADGFLEFGSSGRVFDKSAVVAALAGEPLGSGSSVPTMADFTVRPLSTDIALVTYRSVAATRAHDVLRSSIWQKVGGTWRMAFHQGTPCERPSSATPPAP